MKKVPLLTSLFIYLFFTSCNSDKSFLSKSDIEVVWEKSYREEFAEELGIFNFPIIDGDFIYIPVNKHNTSGPVILKFRKGNGEFVGKWEGNLIGGFYSGARRKRIHIYNHTLFYVNRETQLIAIDLETMTTAWTMNFDNYSPRSFFEAIDDKIYLGLLGTNHNEIAEINLNTMNYRIIYDINMQNQGVFGPMMGQYYPYITEQGDTAIVITEMQQNDDFKLINYNITKDEIIYKVPASDLNGQGLSMSDLSIHNDRIHLSSWDVTNCRKLSDGSRIWTAFMNLNSNGATKPLIKNDRLFYGSDKLFCLNATNGQFIWSKTEEELADQVGFSTHLLLHDNILFCGETPMNAENGKLIEEWFLRDQDNVPNYPFLGPPILDEITNLLYAFGNYELYCLEMPEVD